MNTVVLIMLLIAGAIVLLSRIPGLEHLTRPLVELVVSAIKVTAATMAAWSVYVFKAVWGAHGDVVNHLTKSEAELDPSHAMRNK